MREIPTLAMLSVDKTALKIRAEALASGLSAKELQLEVVEMSSVVGGGTFPGLELASYGVRVRSGVLGADGLAGSLRSAVPPLVGRVEDGCLWIDLRTVLDWQDADVLRLLADHAQP